MLGLLSLPSELLHEIIQICSGRDRRCIRATCKVLNEHADPIVFRQSRLYFDRDFPLIAEHQILSLVTRVSKACEFTRDMEIFRIPNGIRSSELSWPHFGHCDDLRIHLPTAISTLQNATRFRWVISDIDPQWLIDSLMQTIAHLPHLTELDVQTFDRIIKARIPLGLSANLSKLSVECAPDDVSFFISEMATVIGNSPQLKSLSVSYTRTLSALPTLSELFAKASSKNPLCLEELSIQDMNATVDQVVLPHLTHLTSIRLQLRNEAGFDFSVARSVWTSFQVNNIRLSDVEIRGIITEETMLYLSSFSGLKRLAVCDFYAPPDTMENLKNMLFTAVLPKHVATFQALTIWGKYRNTCVFDRTTSKPLMNCLNLCDLCVDIDKSFMPVQLFLDTVAHIPELKKLRFRTPDPGAARDELANFKPTQGLRYVEELTVDYSRYVLEKDGERPVGYRKRW